MNKTLIDLLRCPISFQPLRQASADELGAINRAISAGNVARPPQQGPTAPFASAVITLDGAHAYPIVDDIPVMLADRAMVTGAIDDFPRATAARM